MLTVAARVNPHLILVFVGYDDQGGAMWVRAWTGKPLLSAGALTDPSDTTAAEEIARKGP